MKKWRSRGSRVANRKLAELVKRILTEESDNTLIQIFRYTIVGGFAFVVDFGSLWALTEFAGFHYLVSAALAFVLGLTTNYLLSIAWVFNRRNVENRSKEFLIFAMVGVVGIGVNELMIWSLTEYAGFHYLASKIASTFVVYVWNFGARKILLFR